MHRRMRCAALHVRISFVAQATPAFQFAGGDVSKYIRSPPNRSPSAIKATGSHRSRKSCPTPARLSISHDSLWLTERAWRKVEIYLSSFGNSAEFLCHLGNSVVSNYAVSPKPSSVVTRLTTNHSFAVSTENGRKCLVKRIRVVSDEKMRVLTKFWKELCKWCHLDIARSANKRRAGSIYRRCSGANLIHCIDVETDFVKHACAHCARRSSHWPRITREKRKKGWYAN